MHSIFEAKLASIIEEMTISESNEDIRAVVAVIKCRDKYLLGLSTSKDDRQHKWTHAAGHVKRGESLEQTAIRESKEEFGVRVKVVSGPHKIKGKKDVVYFICRTDTFQQPKVNEEFVVAGWFRTREMKGLKLYKNTQELMEKK